jgi:hypothetical protein
MRGSVLLAVGVAYGRLVGEVVDVGRATDAYTSASCRETLVNRSQVMKALLISNRSWYLRAVVEAVDVLLPNPIEYFQDYWAPSFTAMVLDEERAMRGLRLAETYPIVRELAERASGMSAVDWWDSPRNPRPGAIGGNLEIEGVPVAHPALDFHRLTAAFSDTGHPALTVPCGFSSEGLPIGLQIVADHHADERVLAAGAAYQQATSWLERRPILDDLAL